jgi:hypothetical protein
VLEEGGVVGHSEDGLVRESGLEDTGTGLGVVAYKKEEAKFGQFSTVEGIERAAEMRTFDRNAKLLAVVEDGVEVVAVRGRAKKGVTVHSLRQRLETVEVFLVERVGRLAELEVLVLCDEEDIDQCCSVGDEGKEREKR